MKLKQSVLQVMDRDMLKDAIDELGIDGVDRRDRADMAAALSRKHRATAEFLLQFLSEVQVKEVCELVDVAAVGRRRGLIERLVTGEQPDVAGDSPNTSKFSTRNSNGRTMKNEDHERRSTNKRQKTKTSKPNGNGPDERYEAQLWEMADALRGSMDAAEYKHVVLGLIFLKYISDAFEEQHAKLVVEKVSGADAEDADEYRAQNIFWVPPEARWARLKAQAKQPTIGRQVDDAMTCIERDNPALKGVLPKDYARPALDKQRLGQLIDLISNIKVGDRASRAKDVLGRVYEYFLSQFASAEGKKGGEFYTPRSVVRLLVEMIEPYKGRVYDPCCGSSGMFVQSMEFIRAHASGNGNGGKAKTDISIYGQESNYTTATAFGSRPRPKSPSPSRGDYPGARAATIC